MPASYTHLLIPTRPDYRPAPATVGTFLSLIEAIGIVPEPCDLWLLDRAGSSVVTTPRRSFRIPGRKVPLESVADLAPVLAQVDDYDVRVSGEGIPRRLLMPVKGIVDLLDMRETMHVAVACHGRPQAVGMSNVPAGGAPPDVPAAFAPCTAEDRSAWFTRPDTLQVQEVPHAGAAAFWISVHLGNGLQPTFQDGFEAIPQAFVREFEGILGVNLAQGGTWA